MIQDRSPDPERLAPAASDGERAATRRRLKDMHPGNRFRLMAGLPLLPDSPSNKGLPSIERTKASDFMDGVNDDEL